MGATARNAKQCKFEGRNWNAVTVTEWLSLLSYHSYGSSLQYIQHNNIGGDATFTLHTLTCSN